MEVSEINYTTSYVDWEEVVVTREKGRREFHYYLKRGGGGEDLVVVGKEKKDRHISYHHTIKNKKFLPLVLNRSSWPKLRSQREVIDLLNSIISGEQPNISLRRCEGLMKSKFDDDIVKDVLMQKVGQCGTEFSWVGSYWTCHKRRRHYKSFCRNGAVISVQDFVYVLAEGGKRLVAYLDDMYEDMRHNKMVVVRWFHRIDEVGFVLSPPNNNYYNDREIFSSLCLQDLSIECIDGLATVLSPEHYRSCVNDNKAFTCVDLMPFVCYRQFDNDEVRPFDVTHIKGYWEQEILLRNNISSLVDVVEFNRLSKRVRWSKECDLHLKSPQKAEAVEASVQVGGGTCGSDKGDAKKAHFGVPVKDSGTIKADTAQVLTIGSEVEVLSQDSGIRGCWFRALIIKKHKDKVKIQYKDLKDAIDESKNLEEWIMSSRVAAQDALGIRFSGRPIVRPTPLYNEGHFSSVVNVGTAVDAWWHDGWWEGIVVKKESEDCLYIYFPDEKKESKFTPTELRPSVEWCKNRWQNIRRRPDLVSKLSSTEKVSSGTILHEDTKSCSVPIHTPPQKLLKIKVMLPKIESQPIKDLSKDPLLARLRWKSSGKRRLYRSPVNKLHSPGNMNNSGDEASCQTWEKPVVHSRMNFDSDNCKYNSNFESSVVSSLTNLVMTR